MFFIAVRILWCFLLLNPDQFYLMSITKQTVGKTINLYTLLLVFPWKLKYYNLAEEKPVVKSSFLLIQLVNYSW